MTGNTTPPRPPRCQNKGNNIGYASIAELSSKQASLSLGDWEKFAKKLCDSLLGCFHDRFGRTISKVGAALSAHRYQDRWAAELAQPNTLGFWGIFFWVETNKNGDVTINNIVRLPPTIQTYTQPVSHSYACTYMPIKTN